MKNSVFEASLVFAASLFIAMSIRISGWETGRPCGAPVGADEPARRCRSAACRGRCRPAVVRGRRDDRGRPAWRRAQVRASNTCGRRPCPMLRRWRGFHEPANQPPRRCRHRPALVAPPGHRAQESETHWRRIRAGSDGSAEWDGPGWQGLPSCYLGDRRASRSRRCNPLSPPRHPQHLPKPKLPAASQAGRH